MTTGTHVDLQVVRVHARFREVDVMSVVDAQERLFDMSALMWVGYVMAAVHDRQMGGEKRLSESGERSVQSFAHLALNDTRVQRISLNSPLEIVLTITSIAGAVTIVGEAILRLYNGLQEARMLTASATTHVVAHAAVQRTLEGAGVDTKRDELVEGAARALLNIEHLEVEPDYE